MKSLDEMPVNDAITFYYEKNHALQQSDMETLIKRIRHWLVQYINTIIWSIAMPS